jgi:hypothetical protein
MYLEMRNCDSDIITVDVSDAQPVESFVIVQWFVINILCDGNVDTLPIYKPTGTGKVTSSELLKHLVFEEFKLKKNLGICRRV